LNLIYDVRSLQRSRIVLD